MSDLGGRPPMFDNPEDLQKKIEEYYEHCKPKIIESEDSDEDPQVTDGEQLTITGLALFLGFESRQSLYDYEKRDGFSCIIKKARLRVEHEYEKRLIYNNPTGSIFALKNMGWTDKTEVEQNTKHSGTIAHTVDHSKLSDAALREIAALDKPEASQD